jgi:hypothetical protein
MIQICYQFKRVIVIDLRSYRDPHNKGTGTPTVPVIAHSVPTLSRSIQLLIPAVQEGMKRGVCTNDHVPAITSITPVRSAFRHEGFSAETHASSAAIS